MVIGRPESWFLTIVFDVHGQFEMLAVIMRQMMTRICFSRLGAVK